MKHPKQTGFTIVELLIVVVVIAILAAITIVSYNGITSKARDTKLTSDAGQFDRIVRANQIENPGGQIVRANEDGSIPLGAESFMSANKASALTTEACIRVANHAPPSGEYVATCYPAHVEGEVPLYDKKRLYISADYGYTNGSTVSVSYWSNAEGRWINNHRHTENDGSLRVESPYGSNERLECAPFTSMQYFQAGCVYVQNDL